MYLIALRVFAARCNGVHGLGAVRGCLFRRGFLGERRANSLFEEVSLYMDCVFFLGRSVADVMCRGLTGKSG